MSESPLSGCVTAPEDRPGAACGCAGAGAESAGTDSWERSPHWITGAVESAVGLIPKVSTVPVLRDRLGSWKMRWGIGRFRYSVHPGLYAVGDPGAGSSVFVSANYKMSFDRLRESLAGLSGWILVLDTRGINVWCAAGKGTFGTDEVVRRVRETGLADIVSHRILVLPQLSGPGVSADEVQARCGFQVIFGPVRACDIRKFMDAGMAATPEMRRVRFGFKDRVILTPVEFVMVARHPLFLAFLLLWILGAAGARFLSVDGVALLGAILVGTVAAPALLPWIPGRAFSWKGWILGLVWAGIICFYRGAPGPSAAGWWAALSYVLLLPSLSAFLAMNFTGSTTYTSLSGVVREMKVALPLIILSCLAGIGAGVAWALVKR